MSNSIPKQLLKDLEILKLIAINPREYLENYFINKKQQVIETCNYETRINKGYEKYYEQNVSLFNDKIEELYQDCREKMKNNVKLNELLGESKKIIVYIDAILKKFQTLKQDNYLNEASRCIYEVKGSLEKNIFQNKQLVFFSKTNHFKAIPKIFENLINKIKYQEVGKLLIIEKLHFRSSFIESLEEYKINTEQINSDILKYMTLESDLKKITSAPIIELRYSELSRARVVNKKSNDPNIFNTLKQLKKIDFTNGELLLSSHTFTYLKKLQTLNLTSNGICSLPKNLFRDLINLEHLDLSCNKIEEIDGSIFNSLVNLSSLVLAKNLLKTLDVNAFKGLINLKVLDLTSNKISDLPIAIFRDLQQIEEIKLTNNSMVLLQRDQFRNLNKLRTLCLSNNKIKLLFVNTFVGLRRLQYLELNHNLLTSLPDNVFDDLVNLKYLNFSFNTIHTLPFDLFDNLKKLCYLLLHDNQLTVLPENFFHNLENLRLLNLDNNRLSFIHQNAFVTFHRLTIIFIKGNQLSELNLAELNSKGFDTIICEDSDGSHETTFIINNEQEKLSYEDDDEAQNILDITRNNDKSSSASKSSKDKNPLIETNNTKHHSPKNEEESFYDILKDPKEPNPDGIPATDPANYIIETATNASTSKKEINKKESNKNANPSKKQAQKPNVKKRNQFFTDDNQNFVELHLAELYKANKCFKEYFETVPKYVDEKLEIVLKSRAPKEAKFFHMKGVFSNHIRAYNSALKAFEVACLLDNDKADYHFCKGLAYTALRNEDLAVQCFRRAFLIDPLYVHNAILDSNAHVQNFDNIMRIPEGLRYIYSQEKEIRTNLNQNTSSLTKSLILNQVRIDSSKKTATNFRVIKKTSNEVRVDPASNTAINRIINLSNTNNDQNEVIPRRTSNEIRIDSNHVLKTNPTKRPPIEIKQDESNLNMPTNPINPIQNSPLASNQNNNITPIQGTTINTSNIDNNKPKQSKTSPASPFQNSPLISNPNDNKEQIQSTPINPNQMNNNNKLQSNSISPISPIQRSVITSNDTESNKPNQSNLMASKNTVKESSNSPINSTSACLFELFDLILKEQEKANRYFENYIKIKNKHLKFNAKEKIEFISIQTGDLISENMNITYAKGVFYNQIGDYKRAAILFEYLCKRYPANAEYLFNRAFSLSFLNELDLAEQLFKQASELYPEYSLTFDSKEISKHNVSFVSDYSLDTSSLEQEIKVREERNTSSFMTTDGEDDKSKNKSVIENKVPNNVNKPGTTQSRLITDTSDTETSATTPKKTFGNKNEKRNSPYSKPFVVPKNKNTTHESNKSSPNITSIDLELCDTRNSSSVMATESNSKILIVKNTDKPRSRVIFDTSDTDTSSSTPKTVIPNKSYSSNQQESSTLSLEDDSRYNDNSATTPKTVLPQTNAQTFGKSRNQFPMPYYNDSENSSDLTSLEKEIRDKLFRKNTPVSATNPSDDEALRKNQIQALKNLLKPKPTQKNKSLISTVKSDTEVKNTVIINKNLKQIDTRNLEKPVIISTDLSQFCMLTNDENEDENYDSDSSDSAIEVISTTTRTTQQQHNAENLENFIRNSPDLKKLSLPKKKVNDE